MPYKLKLCQCRTVWQFSQKYCKVCHVFQCQCMFPLANTKLSFLRWNSASKIFLAKNTLSRMWSCCKTISLVSQVNWLRIVGKVLFSAVLIHTKSHDQLCVLCTLFIIEEVVACLYVNLCEFVQCEDGVIVVVWWHLQDVVLYSSSSTDSVLVVWFPAGDDRLYHYAAGVLLPWFTWRPSTCFGL